MNAKSTWMPILAEAIRHGEVAQDFLSLVVEPSLSALEKKRCEIASQPDEIVATFHLYDHCQLMAKTSMALLRATQRTANVMLQGKSTPHNTQHLTSQSTRSPPRCTY